MYLIDRHVIEMSKKAFNEDAFNLIPASDEEIQDIMYI